MELKKKQKFKNCQKGSVLTLVLVFGAIFILIFGGMASFVFTQYKLSKERVAFSQALEIAEAGANYSRWHLAHAANDFGFSGVYDYIDPEGGAVGKYSIEITDPGGECSTIVSIKSTGWSNDYPNVKRTILVRYGRRSLAQYAFLANSDVWIGLNEEVRGPLHSNGGVRMDGIQNALFTSATSTYNCLPAHGCANPFEVKPGIWGSGSGGAAGLWTFPVPAVDFNAITVDLAQLKAKAQTGGYYFGPSGAFGYHIEFKNDGTFNLYRVTKLKANVLGCDTSGNCSWDSNDIDKQSFIDDYALGEDSCSVQNLIFVEDGKVWVDGVLKEKATLAAARFPDNPATNASIIINGNLVRADPTDTVAALIAQKNILVPLYSNNILEIQAVMIAQKGAVQRLYYSDTYNPNHKRNKIMVRGSIITNKPWTWRWIDGTGAVVSGYDSNESYYEPALIYNPPPFFPSSGELEFISWEELPS